MNWLDRCHFGDVRAVLRRMIADGVQVNAIVTSPPYWGLRSYLPENHPDKHLELGSEKTFAEFLKNMVEVFELCRQVLRPDGTLWCNMGDSYASRPNGPTSANATALHGDRAHKWKEQHAMRSKGTTDGFKHKDMIGQPWRLAFALQDAGWWLRQDVVWHKPNPMPESAKDRCTKAHEYIFLLAKSATYYWDFEAMQEPASGTANPRRATIKKPDGWATHEGAHGAFHREGREKGQHQPLPKKRAAEGNDSAYGDGKSERMGRGAGWRARKLAEDREAKNNSSMDEALADMRTMRNRRSVWTIPSERYSGSHFATFPRALVEPCIVASCPVGGVVLDPFFGSGTAGQVANDLGRHFIGIDLNSANQPLQDERLQQRAFILESP